MPTVQTVLDAIERIAPAATAYSSDRIGLQVGNPGDPVTSAAVALDCSPALIDFAAGKQAHLVVCHHPIIWEPLTAVNDASRPGRLVTQLIRRNIAFIGSHTNWDAAPGGINDRLASLLGVLDSVPIGWAQSVPYFKLVTFAPAGHAERLIDAMAGAGAGVIGLYERCAFSSEGTGTFRPSEGARPTVGKVGEIAHAEEVRIEMRLPEAKSDAVVQALVRAHPYDEAAYDLYPLSPVAERPFTRLGRLASPVSLAEFVKRVDSALQTRSWAFGDPERRIERVAVCGGAADDEWRSAFAAGADAFVTGEVKHHNAIEAAESGMAILASGHFATEHPGSGALCEALTREVPEVAWHFFTPPIGVAGRAI